MLRWSVANLFIIFNFKRWRVLSGLSLKFWFSHFSLNSFENLFWNFEKQTYLRHLGFLLLMKIKFLTWKLSLNSQKLLVLLMSFMAGSSRPFSIKWKPFLPRHSFPILLLPTISSLREFKWSFKFSTVRDALPSLV